MKFSEYINVISDQDIITINILNGELFHGQLKDLKLEDFYNLENQKVYKIQSEILSIDDECFVNTKILLDYVLRFGE